MTGDFKSHLTPGQRMTFTSYPAALYSRDDFYQISGSVKFSIAGVAVTDYNRSLWSETNFTEKVTKFNYNKCKVFTWLGLKYSRFALRYELSFIITSLARIHPAFSYFLLKIVNRKVCDSTPVPDTLFGSWM